MQPSDILELFYERVAICEVCGGMLKEEAEWIAYLDVKKLAGRTPEGRAIPLPKEIVDKVKESKKQKFLF